MTIKKKSSKPRKAKVHQPWLQIGKKKHPFGKPIDMHFENLRMWVAMSYMTQVGLSKTGGIGFGKSTPNDVTIFFDDKLHSGMLHFDETHARKLYEKLKMFYDTDRKGFVKKTYAGESITKYQRYKEIPKKKSKKKVK